jgi:hypothetical protein
VQFGFDQGDGEEMRRTITLAATLAAATLGAGASTAAAAQVSIGDAGVVTEGSKGAGGTAEFTIRTHVAHQEVAGVEYQVATSAGTAVAGQDFVEASDTVADDRMPPCDKPEGCTQTRTFKVSIVADQQQEPDETLSVKLTSGTMTVTDGEGSATIADDDGPGGSTKSGGGDEGGYSNSDGGGDAGKGGDELGKGGDGSGNGGDEVGPRMAMKFRGLRGAKARVRATCPEAEVSCRGRLAIRLDGQTLGSARFRMKGGDSRLVVVRLPPEERRRLKRAGVGEMRARAIDKAGNSLVRDRAFQV